VLLIGKSIQKTRDRQIGSQFQGYRPIPFTAMDLEEKHGRATIWKLRAKEAPEHIKANWPGCSWIIEMVTTTITATTRNGRTTTSRHLFLASIRTTPEALLRLIRQRWSMERVAQSPPRRPSG
jgi:hypothetical protein